MVEMTVHGTVVAGNREIRTIHVAADIDQHALARVLSDAGLPSRVPVVVLVGGASNMAAELQTALTRLFAEAIVPAVERAAGCLVDGGTKAGVMALAGDARQRTGARFPHVGVVAEGTVQWPGRASSNPQAAALEPNHSHVVVVPGDQWEDSAPWLARVGAAIAVDAPTVTVLVNGGPISYADVAHSLAAGRPVLVVSGSGGTADQVGAARGGQPADAAAGPLAGSPLVHVVERSAGPAAVAAALGDFLRA
jgi:hypothetical protein